MSFWLSITPTMAPATTFEQSGFPGHAPPASRRRPWSGMAGTACYSSNAFCGPIEGEMKLRSITAAKTSQPAAKGPRPELDLGGGFAGACFVSRVI